MPDIVTLHIVPFNTHNLGSRSLGSWKGNSPVLGKVLNRWKGFGGDGS